MTEYESSFLSEKRPVLIAKNVTTKYTERGQNNTENVRHHILAVINNTRGHIAFFSPSYALRDDVLGDCSWLPGHIKIIDEEKRMSKSRVNGIIQELHNDRRDGTQVLLSGVLSGKLAEGVDYPNNILCLLYTSPSPRDGLLSRMPSSA